MLGSCDGIAIRNVNRGVGFETLGKAAASGAAQACRGDVFDGDGFHGVDVGCFLPRSDFHLVQHVDGFENVVVMGGFHHVVYRVVLVADAAEHEAADTFVQRNFVMAVGISHHAFVDDFPIDVHARYWGFYAVAFFINGALDESLRQSGGGEGE